MIVKYTPAGEQAREFEWDGGNVRAAEAELIEATFESTFSDWNYQVMMGSIRARRILLWRLLCHEHPTKRLDDVDFAAKELSVDFNADEYQELRDAVQAAKGVPEAKRIQALSLIDRQIEEATPAPGKAPSESSETVTS